MFATVRIATVTLGASAVLAASAACGALAVTALSGHHLLQQPAAAAASVRATVGHASAALHQPTHLVRVSPADFVWP
jgi:hypothetical protein